MHTIAQALLMSNALASDPYYSSVKSLSSFDEGAGAAIPIDAISSQIWTNTNAVVQSGSAFGKFGSGSIRSSGGVSGGYRVDVTVPGSGANLNFTAELWVYFTGLYIPTGRNNRFWDVSGGGNGHTLMVEEGTNALWYLDSAFTETMTSATVTLNTWNHFAITADGTSVQVFYNGARVLTIANTIRLPVDGSNICLYSPGRCARGSGDFYSGYIDEARLTTGIVRYTGAGFTVPTAAYPRF